MTKVFLKTEYNFDTDAESEKTGITFRDKSLTIQSQKDEADINTIVKRFGLDKNPNFGAIPLPPGLEDFQDTFDFQTAMNTIRAADESFAQLHPDVRAQFQNDPARFVGHIDHILNEEDPKKRERGLETLREMGLAVPAEPAPVVPPVAAGTANGTPPATPVGGGS